MPLAVLGLERHREDDDALVSRLFVDCRRPIPGLGVGGGVWTFRKECAAAPGEATDCDLARPMGRVTGKSFGRTGGPDGCDVV